MKLVGDSVQFESRYNEVDALSSVLGQWIEEHPDADPDQRNAAERLQHLLDVLYMEW